VNDTQAQALRQLESDTRNFRSTLAREHRARWVAENKRAKAAIRQWDPEGPELDELDGPPAPSSTFAVQLRAADALSVAAWHKGRDNGQKYRFRKLALCGTRVMVALCKACEVERAPVAEGCGITRLCAACSLRNAKKRRGRFGRGRARVSIELARIGYVRTRRRQRARGPGGLWSDKMITLTVPHFLLPHVEPGALLLAYGKADAECTTMARIYAVRAAWPLFARQLARWFRLGGTSHKPKKYDVPRAPIGVPLADGTIAPPPMHRAFEWTVGGDGLGHPHFHLWMLAPYIPETEIRRMWTKALREVGVPLEPDAYVRVQIQSFRDFDRSAVGELIKGGSTRQALEWSRLYKHGPANAFEYADGWTIAAALEDARPEVIAGLYKALEGARLTQASRGFFVEDEAPACETCKAQGCWHVRFEPQTDAELERLGAPPRGPPRCSTPTAPD
jgi:hypothetical protein